MEGRCFGQSMREPATEKEVAALLVEFGGFTTGWEAQENVAQLPPSLGLISPGSDTNKATIGGQLKMIDNQPLTVIFDFEYPKP